MSTCGYLVEFDEVEVPIREPVTKFGGQPVWQDKPTWPISKTTRQPMTFICQIVIPADLFPNVGRRIVYLFMADYFGNLHPETWDPDSGDNAVILQPGNLAAAVEDRASGPTIERWYEPRKPKNFFERLVLRKAERARRECEFATRLKPYDSETTRPGRDAKHFGGGTKIGGQPDFVQAEEYPPGDGWRLLLQLDSARVPFEINFGDAGIGYLFLSADGCQGKFLWQCL